MDGAVGLKESVCILKPQVFLTEQGCIKNKTYLINAQAYFIHRSMISIYVICNKI